MYPTPPPPIFSYVPHAEKKETEHGHYGTSTYVTYCKTLIWRVFLFDAIGGKNKNRPKYGTRNTVSEFSHKKAINRFKLLVYWLVKETLQYNFVRLDMSFTNTGCMSLPWPGRWVKRRGCLNLSFFVYQACWLINMNILIAVTYFISFWVIFRKLCM